MKPDRRLNPKIQGRDANIITIVFTIAVFFLDHPHKSMHEDIMFSNTAITVEKAANAINIKKQLPHILPPGI